MLGKNHFIKAMQTKKQEFLNKSFIFLDNMVRHYAMDRGDHRTIFIKCFDETQLKTALENYNKDHRFSRYTYDLKQENGNFVGWIIRFYK